jgi:hypothetical protein
MSQGRIVSYKKEKDALKRSKKPNFYYVLLSVFPSALALQHPNQYQNGNEKFYLVRPIDYYGMDLPF